MITMSLCFVKGCRNSDRKVQNGITEEITFHSFPKTMQLQSKWLTTIGRDPNTLINQQRICSEHFNPEDFELERGSGKIKATVIPTRFTGVPIPKKIKLRQPKNMDYERWLAQNRKRKMSVNKAPDKEIRKRRGQCGRKRGIAVKKAKTRDFHHPTDDVEVKEEIPDEMEDQSVYSVVKEEAPFDAEVKIEEEELDSCKSSPRSGIDEAPPVQSKTAYIDPSTYRVKMIGELRGRLCDCKSNPNPNVGSQRLVIHHPSLDLYKCSACDFNTNQLLKLRRHVNFKHDDYLMISKYKCDICGYSSNFAGNLRQHMLVHIHRFEVVYACDKCRYKTTQQDDLHYHRKTHMIKTEGKG